MRVKEEKSFIWLIQFLVAIIEKSGKLFSASFLVEASDENVT